MQATSPATQITMQLLSIAPVSGDLTPSLKSWLACVVYIEISLLRAKQDLPGGSRRYLLHWKLERCFAIRELHGNAGALNFGHNIVQFLGLLQHLPVAATKLPKHTVGHVRDAVCRVAKCAPQSLKNIDRPSLRTWPSSKFTQFMTTILAC